MIKTRTILHVVTHLYVRKNSNLIRTHSLQMVLLVIALSLDTVFTFYVTDNIKLSYGS